MLFKYYFLQIQTVINVTFEYYSSCGPSHYRVNGIDSTHLTRCSISRSLVALDRTEFSKLLGKSCHIALIKY